MSTTALGRRARPTLRGVGLAVDWLTRHALAALGAIVLVQVAATIALFFSVNRNGWLTYQGGDQIWLATTGWLLGDGTIGYALTGYGWPLLLAPLTWLVGPSSIELLPLTTVLQVGVLGPVATLAVYDIGSRLAGRVAGLWGAAVFVAAPFVAIPFFVASYHDRWVDQLLPQALGLTQQADFPSVVAVLVAVALVLRSFEAGAYREALLAGSIAGFALALKPANALFLAGPALGYLVARRPRQAALFALALVPPLLTLALWKQRGIGELPLFALPSDRVAAGLAPDLPLANAWFERTVPLDLDVWKENMSNLREFGWSARIAQWLPLAGALAVARRSMPAAALLLGWLLGYVVIKGSVGVATIESGSFWRLIMPGLPAYALLAAAIPLLVPTLPGRLGSRIAPQRGGRPGRHSTAVVVLAVVPLVVVLAASVYRVVPNPSPPPKVFASTVVVDAIEVPQDEEIVALSARRLGAAAELSWTDSTSRARTFYRVYRASEPSFPDVICEPRGVDFCELRAELLTTTRERRFVDPAPPPDAVYRIGVAANWLDDPERGDVFAISPPVAP